MKIATTTGDFDAFCVSDEERIRELHRAGFKYIDLSMYSLTPDCAYMGDGWKKEVCKLKDLADELGMQFVQAHSQGGNGLSDDKAHVDYLIATTVRSIEICRELGIKNTVVHSGLAKGISKDEWFERNKVFYQKLFPAAERCGVNVLCENTARSNVGDMYFIISGKDMREFIDYVGHPLFHGCWDTGHANCQGSQYDDITALGRHLYAIHYNDNRGALDEHLSPFLGTLNHDEVMHALIDVGFKGYFTLECCSSLRPYKYWLGNRRPFDGDKRLAQPQLFMQRSMEKMTYETAEYILKTYDLFED
ncbi:MAG: sugar phosphate isomerase/epimerase [Clostridia bacterium]|nr:sugar phosphate isomerase/epimerase [Clostridia bacterium]